MGADIELGGLLVEEPLTSPVVVAGSVAGDVVDVGLVGNSSSNCAIFAIVMVMIKCKADAQG